MTRIAVIDFETTGISPGQGDRATEVAIVLLEGGRVVDRFQSLMNAGVRIPSFITQLTGITNAMVAAAPPAAQVMAEAARFVGDAPMVAHNASFDRKFWQAELARPGCPRRSLLPAPCCCRAGCTRRRPATSWARWSITTACRARGRPTGRWPMPRWPPPAGAHPGRSARTLCGARAHARAAAGAADLAARGRAEAARRVPLRGMRKGAPGERAQVRRTTTLPIE
jgi:hypothetical protein